MILSRFCDKAGKPVIFPASSKVKNYDGDEGWFPVESFQFGFSDKKDDDKNKDKTKDAKSQQPSQSTGGPTGGKRKREFAACKITKKVDSVTALLMLLAMKERETKRGEDSKLEADIHIISSVQISQNADQFTFTSLMIHLESVNLETWEINGSGDNRPEESVSLRYDRGAMIYVPTPDARVVKPLIGPKGWNQTTLKEFGPGSGFNWNEALWQDFLPKKG